MSLFHEKGSYEHKMMTLWVVLVILFIGLYMAIFPKSLGRDWYLVPVKSYDFDSVPTEGSVSNGRFFRLADHEGIISSNGDLISAWPARSQGQISNEFTAYYDQKKDLLEVYHLDSLLFEKPFIKFPYWSNNRLYSFDENRMGLTEFDLKGNPLWTKQFSSVITAIDAGKNLSVVGSLDGKMQIWDKSGNLRTQFIPGGSKYPVIFNVSISADENKVLLLSGISPKRFILLEKGGAEFRPVFHETVQENSRFPTPLGFLDQRWAYYTTSKGLKIIDTQNYQGTEINFLGSLQSIKFLPQENLIVAVTCQDSVSMLKVWTLSGATLFQTPFQSKNSSLIIQNNKIILISDQNMVVMERKKE